jgi:hypothetical protein
MRSPTLRQGGDATNSGVRQGDTPEEERADDTQAAVERGQADEERKGIDSEREDQPAEEANGESAEDEPYDEHGGRFRDNRCDGRDFHHRRGTV